MIRLVPWSELNHFGKAPVCWYLKVRVNITQRFRMKGCVKLKDEQVMKFFGWVNFGNLCFKWFPFQIFKHFKTYLESLSLPAFVDGLMRLQRVIWFNPPIYEGISGPLFTALPLFTKKTYTARPGQFLLKSAMAHTVLAIHRTIIWITIGYVHFGDAQVKFGNISSILTIQSLQKSVQNFTFKVKQLQTPF